MTDEELRAALLTTPRAPLKPADLPPAVRANLETFSEATSVEVREVAVGGVPYFEVLGTFESLEDEGTFVAGTVFDARGTEVADLDFAQRVATFPRSASEQARDGRFAAFLGGFFTEERLAGRALAAAKISVPKGLEAEEGAHAYQVEFEGRRYVALVSGAAGAREVLVYDERSNGLGGSYHLGKEPFDVAEPEVTLPLSAKPAPATGKRAPVDGFESRAAPKVRI